MRAIILLAMLLSWIGASAAQTTQPSLEARAQQAFNTGDWAVAVDLLEQLRDKYALVMPERVGAIDEQIRVARRSLATGAPAPEIIPTEPGLRRRHVRPVGGVYDLSIKALGNFDYDNVDGGNIPDDVLALTGTTVRLKGYMIPMDQADSITSFALVPDLFACCFGQPPQIQHIVVARTPPGKTVAYYPDEIVVEGKLLVEEKKEDGFIVSIFELEVSNVRPAAK